MEHVIEIANINNAIVFRDNDIYAIQNRVNAIEAMLNTIGEAFIVSGCVVSGTAPNNAISAGIVFLDGKLHSLPAVPTIDLATTKHIKFLSATDSDPRTLSGGGTQNRIKTYLAQVSNSPAVSPLQHIEIDNFTPNKNFGNTVVKKSLFIEEYADLIPTLQSGWLYLVSSVAPFRVIKNYPRRRQLAGQAIYNGGGTTILQISDAQLLSGTRMRFAVALTKHSTGEIKTIGVTMEVDGRLTVDSITLGTLATNDLISLDNIIY